MNYIVNVDLSKEIADRIKSEKGEFNGEFKNQNNLELEVSEVK